MTNGLDDRQKFDDLFAAAYDELRRLASAVKGRDKSVTLNPTALVHEVWLKMSASAGVTSTTSQLHFKRIAARAMRQVLIEAVRRRKALKRGGNDAVFVTMEPSAEPTLLVGDELLALDDVLDKLAQMNPRQAMMVESRFFGGLEIPEIAELLEVSEATVLRDWRAARAWLAQELRT